MSDKNVCNMMNKLELFFLASGSKFSLPKYPNVKEMWEWIKGRITKKLGKWNRQYLSLAGRF